MSEGAPTAPGGESSDGQIDETAAVSASPAPELIAERPVPTLPPPPGAEAAAAAPGGSPVGGLAERPEVLVGAAFAGGLVLALILRRVTS